MVSSSFNAGSRYCPALEKTIASERCGRERLTHLDCPLSCPFNPFNADAPASFDSVFGRGLKNAGRWIEKVLGPGDWSRRYREMERRFSPENDIPLISFETEWVALNQPYIDGEKLRDRIAGPDGRGLRNDTRIVLQKLADSRVYLLETLRTADGLPFYECRDAIQPERTFRYVDFGEQEPLEVGAILLGRFLEHEGCLFVVPGIFVGTAALKENFCREFETGLGLRGPELAVAMQDRLPELWNLCADLQDAFDEVEEVDPLDDEDEADSPSDEYYRATFRLRDDKIAATLALRGHPLFVEDDPKEFGVDLFETTVFHVNVVPSSPFAGEFDDPDSDTFQGEELDVEEPVRVGTVFLEQEVMLITAFSAVELELLKALVQSLIPCEA